MRKETLDQLWSYIRRLEIYFMGGVLLSILYLVMQGGQIFEVAKYIKTILAFSIVVFIMERIMFMLYTKITNYTIIRIVITVLVGRILLVTAYWIVEPNLAKWVIHEKYDNIITFPTCLLLAVGFELYFGNTKNNYNAKLQGFKVNSQRNHNCIKRYEGNKDGQEE